MVYYKHYVPLSSVYVMEKLHCKAHVTLQVGSSKPQHIIER